MWEEALQISLKILLLIIFLLIGIISVFLYRQTNKRGFVPIGIGFILEAIYSFIPLSALMNILTNTFITEEAFSFFLLIDITVQVILMILVLVGVILLRSEFKSKPTP